MTIPSVAMWVMFVLTPNGHGDRIVTMQSFLTQTGCENAVKVLKSNDKYITSYCVRAY